MTPFIPEHELTSLLKGSFQETSILVSEALKEEQKRLGDVRLVATFPKHVVVMSEAGEAYKLGYELSASGNVHFTKQEPLDVTVVTERNLRKYVQNEAKEAVDLFLKGLSSQANERIAAILPLVDESAFVSDEELIGSFVESRSQDRDWKKLIASRKESVRGYLGEGVDITALQPKFKKLYDGSTSAAELPTFKTLVGEDVDYVVVRLNAVRKNAEAALHTIRSVRDAAVAEGGESTIGMLEAFASDLLNDVKSVEEFVSEARNEISRVDLLAKVFDSLAEEVASFEVAGAFAAKMAARLAEAGR